MRVRDAAGIGEANSSEMGMVEVEAANAGNDSLARSGLSNGLGCDRPEALRVGQGGERRAVLAEARDERGLYA